MVQSTGNPVTDVNGRLGRVEEELSEIRREQRAIDGTILELTRTVHVFSSDLREVITGVAAIHPLYEEKLGNIKRDLDRLERYGETIRSLAEKLPIIRDECKNDIRAVDDKIMDLKTHINRNESRARGWLDSANALWLLFGGVIATGIGWLASQAFQRN